MGRTHHDEETTATTPVITRRLLSETADLGLCGLFVDESTIEAATTHVVSSPP